MKTLLCNTAGAYRGKKISPPPKNTEIISLTDFEGHLVTK